MISGCVLERNKHIFAPSHRCTCLSSQYPPASESTAKMLVTRRENFAGGNFATFLNGEMFPATSPPPKVSHVPQVSWHTTPGREALQRPDCPR